MNLKLWVAQGFGVGKIPFGPGTFGSLVGLLWFALLLAPRNPLVFWSGTLVGIGLSVWLCGEGEKILKQKDPGSVVLDEIAAIPVCFTGWVAALLWKGERLPGLDYFLGHKWPLALGILVTFRFFDIVKPWPVRQSQSLPGGWGVTVDDLLAAGYVNLAAWLASMWVGF